MFDQGFAQWFLSRVVPFRDVPPEKLQADREAMERQQEFNQHYQDFLKEAVLPAIEGVSQLLYRNKVLHRVTTWGNQIAIRIHLAWRWGELVISQSHEDCVTFDHHIITEGEKRGDDSMQDHGHVYDLRDPLPAVVALQEIQFFLTRVAQDLFESETPELPPGEGKSQG